MMSKEGLKIKITCCVITLFLLVCFKCTSLVKLTVGEVVWEVSVSSFWAVSDGFSSV